MKNSLAVLLRVAGSVLVIFLTITADAAPANELSGNPAPGDNLRLNEVKSRAARHFLSRFPNTSNEKWSRSMAGYSVKFTQKNVLTSIYYDRLGYCINTIRYYKEENIPMRLKKLVQREFPDFEIESATEVTMEKQTSFTFNIKNTVRFLTVKVVNDEFEITGDYKTPDSVLQ